jgi:NAD(P)H-dependent flavin oxidoreductase YrpB (nitropropane dioxygenase family)
VDVFVLDGSGGGDDRDIEVAVALGAAGVFIGGRSVLIAVKKGTGEI